MDIEREEKKHPQTLCLSSAFVVWNGSKQLWISSGMFCLLSYTLTVLCKPLHPPGLNYIPVLQPLELIVQISDCVCTNCRHVEFHKCPRSGCCSFNLNQKQCQDVTFPCVVRELIHLNCLWNASFPPSIRVDWDSTFLTHLSDHNGAKMKTGSFQWQILPMEHSCFPKWELEKQGQCGIRIPRLVKWDLLMAFSVCYSVIQRINTTLMNGCE